MRDALKKLDHPPGSMLRSVTKWELVPGFDRYAVSKDGRVWTGKNGHLLKPYPNQSGRYLIVKLYPGEVQRSVHSLVIEAFRGPPGENQVAHHENEDTKDNQLENLRYVTPEENQNLADCGREVCEDSILSAKDDAPF